ncbi:MAG TPA: stage II sporulation protein M [Acidisarcina sp.]
MAAMISNQWIERRRPYWNRMDALLQQMDASSLHGLSREELREMALIYRQIASDLSAVRQDRTSHTLERYLNQLLGRAHNIIYSGRKTNLISALRFLRDDYPVIFRRLLPFTLAAVGLFMAGGLVGSLLTVARPDFMRALLGPEMVATIEKHEMWTHSIVSVKPQTASFLMTHNLSVTFATFAAGITAGLGTVYLLVWNGVLIGVVGTACHQAGMSVDLWSFVAGHGSLELPAIFISGGAGLRLAYGMLFPGMYSRSQSIALAGAESVKLMAGVVPLLIVAGTVEGFFSPSGLPVAWKFCLGATLFSLLIFWLFGYRSPVASTNNAGVGALASDALPATLSSTPA